MIATREDLIHVLTEAAEVEHNLLCSYLYAAFSLKRAGEEGLTEAQGEAVEGWRKTILKVAVEEMAHLACVNNLLLAVGGAPHFDRPNFPVAPGYHPADLVVRLTPFDEATLDHFIFLERPATLALPDGGGFEPEGVERTAHKGRLTPSSQDYATIGELYDAITEGFVRLSRELGEACLIDPQGLGQLDSEMIKLPDAPRVTDLAGALAALDHIKEQGEGSTGVNEDSHFERFKSIREVWGQMRLDDADFRPAWPAAHDPVMRKPADASQRVWVTEPLAAQHLDLANALYGLMLGLLSQAFGMPADKGEQVRFMATSVELMEAVAAVSSKLARLPAGPDNPGVNAGMSFAVPRNLGFRPAQDVAAHFSSRISMMRENALSLLEGEAAEKALRRLDKALALISGAAEPA